MKKTVQLLLSGFLVAVMATGCAGTRGNRVLQLNGSSEYVRVGDHEALRLARGDFTMAAYVYINAFTKTNNAVLSKRGGGSRDGWTFFVAGDTWPQLARKVIYHVSQGDNPFIVSNMTLEAGQFYHLCLVYRAAREEITLYIDGEADATAEKITAPNPRTAAEMLIGRDSSAPRYFFNGMLDDVCIFQRALFPEEVKALTRTSLTGTEQGLLASWNFDKADARDGTANAFDGEIVE